MKMIYFRQWICYFSYNMRKMNILKEFFDRLSYSLDMNNKEAFYISGKEPNFVDKERIKEFKLAMLGYSRHNVYDFLMITLDI